jgi:phage FluMu protein Com
MADQDYKYIWRCAKCTYHFSSIYKAEGIIKQEKKCPKCKSMNSITLTNKEIYIHCKFYDPRTSAYSDEVEESHMYYIGDS